eukprot:comp20883_c0_seq1/m.43429 comp20883_c0_seq1/g.43429  ORF comp20883_c0_seq1/g.43429 comp20883_c0_seq1/m.43429 type:complete len:358 (-) comp20883_c0_seq1:13-1086(-)
MLAQRLGGFPIAQLICICSIFVFNKHCLHQRSARSMGGRPRKHRAAALQKVAHLRHLCRRRALSQSKIALQRLEMDFGNILVHTRRRPRAARRFAAAEERREKMRVLCNHDVLADKIIDLLLSKHARHQSPDKRHESHHLLLRHPVVLDRQQSAVRVLVRVLDQLHQIDIRPQRTPSIDRDGKIVQRGHLVEKIRWNIQHIARVELNNRGLHMRIRRRRRRRRVMRNHSWRLPRVGVGVWEHPDSHIFRRGQQHNALASHNLDQIVWACVVVQPSRRVWRDPDVGLGLNVAVAARVLRKIHITKQLDVLQKIPRISDLLRLKKLLDKSVRCHIHLLDLFLFCAAKRLFFAMVHEMRI